MRIKHLHLSLSVPGASRPLAWRARHGTVAVVLPKPLNRLASINPHTPTRSSVYVNILILWGFLDLSKIDHIRKQVNLSLARREKSDVRVLSLMGDGNDGRAKKKEKP